MNDTVPIGAWLALTGRYAIALFFVVLALLLAATLACWRARGHRFRRSPAASGAGARVVIGAGVVIAALGVVLMLLVMAGLPHAVTLDAALGGALRAGVSGQARTVFAIVTHLADPATLAVLCIVIAAGLLATGHRALARGCVIAIAGNAVLNRTLKALVSRTRPEPIDGHALEHGFSFPSGHSSGAVVTYGVLAYVVVRLLPERWHLPALAAAVAIAFTVGASRVFLNAHFPSDVAAGFASGSAWLAMCIMGMERVRRGRGPAS